MRRVHITAVIAVVILFGSLEYAATPVAAQEGSSLSGLLCSEDYGEGAGADERSCRGGGLPDADLTLTGEGTILGLDAAEYSTTSDERGYWIFSGVEDGSYTLTVERAGFETLETTVTIPDETKMELSLTGQQVDVTGLVTDREGGAVSGATVGLQGPEHLEAETGSDGRFTLTLQAGHYSVELWHDDYRRGYEYTLLDGQSEATFEMEKAPERTATITGTVHDQDGTPVADATVEVNQWGYYEEPRPATASSDEAGMTVASPEPYPYYDDGYQRATTGSDGGFTVDVYAGHVNLNVWKDGHARYWDDFEIADGETRDEDIELQRFPDKTAHITGQVTDADSGDGLRWISVNVQSPEFGIYECSVYSADQTDADAVEPGFAPYYDRCAITIGEDGSFEGDVTPGYSILRVYYEHYRSCQETQHADGSYTRSCGQDYFQHVQTLDLPADTDTRIDVALQPKPGPDAVLSGYVVDEETQKALSGVRVSISNQDNYGYAWATTDEDGSYKVRIRSGYHQVSVWAEGYLNWEGVVEVPSDTEVPFDIMLTAGQNQYGGWCCYAYDDRVMVAEASDSAGSSGATSASAPQPAPTAASEETETQDFEDLGGGLGPYDPEARSQALEDFQEGRDIPAPGLLALLGVVAVALWVRRPR